VLGRVGWPPGLTEAAWGAGAVLAALGARWLLLWHDRTAPPAAAPASAEEDEPAAGA
jgi:hypothetical protein